MREPYIRSYPLYDLYISPEELETRQPGATEIFLKGETKTLSGWDVTFSGFDVSSHDSPGSIEVGAMVTAVSAADSVHVVPRLVVLEHGEREYVPAVLDGDTIVTLDEVDPSHGMVRLRVSDAGEVAREILVVEVSTKPLVMLVWLGAAMMIAGAFVSWNHRRRGAASRAELRGFSQL
jgi:hypothetical protein